tara:strand:+ start:727 stop:945 length:219 start_codon:yes stop_codon:yes gene_type:complete
MYQGIELTNINESSENSENSESNEHSENTVITIPNTETESQSCWHENRCTFLFLFSAALGFLWVGLNLGGYI